MVAEPGPFKARIPVSVCAGDPLSRAGLVSQLRRAQGFLVVTEGDEPEDVVALVVADELDPNVLAELRVLRGRGIRRIVLLVSRVDDRSLLAGAAGGGLCARVVSRTAQAGRFGRARLYGDVDPAR